MKSEETEWATHKFESVIRGRSVTHELWLPLHLTPQDVCGVMEGLLSIVPKEEDSFVSKLYRKISRTLATWDRS